MFSRRVSATTHTATAITPGAPPRKLERNLRMIEINCLCARCAVELVTAARATKSKTNSTGFATRWNTMIKVLDNLISPGRVFL
jgi:hypothetical protein